MRSGHNALVCQNLLFLACSDHPGGRSKAVAASTVKSVRNNFPAVARHFVSAARVSVTRRSRATENHFRHTPGLGFCWQAGSATALSIAFFLRAVSFSTVVRYVACGKRILSRALYRTVGWTPEKVVDVLPAQLT